MTAAAITAIASGAVVQSPEARARISAEWARVGGGFTVPPGAYAVDLEALIVRSAQQAPADARLFFVAASWTGVHHVLVDAPRLARALDPLDPTTSAVAGALLDVANMIARAPQLDALAAHCRPLVRPRVLFDGTAADPWLAEQTRRNALPVFTRWGLYCDDISLKTAAVRPLRWIARHCPELRARAVSA